METRHIVSISALGSTLCHRVYTLLEDHPFPSCYPFDMLLKNGTFSNTTSFPASTRQVEAQYAVPPGPLPKSMCQCAAAKCSGGQSKASDQRPWRTKACPPEYLSEALDPTRYPTDDDDYWKQYNITAIVNHNVW